MPKPSTDFLAELNPAQRAAAQHTTGPGLIIAGAGSGKTRVLTYRLAHLMRLGLADSFELLALTFTNKAAREMRHRIEALVGPEARNLVMGTFHSVFARILRIEADHLGYTRNFTIYDDDDSHSLVKNIVRELGLDDKTYKPRGIQHRISGAKNYLVSPQEYADRYVTDSQTEVTARVYARYAQRCFQANAMDFDDLLLNMVKLFQASPQSLHRYQHRFKFIMVDEFQDTNHAQYIITRKLAAVHENVVVVGDDAQSIYSFRGATIENILGFQKDYPDLQVYKLEQNYRSTGTLVAMANEIISHNKHQLPKVVYTENETGELVRTVVGATEQDEALRVVDLIREQRFTYSLHHHDIALLYRTNAQSRALEDALRRAGIPYRVFGGLSFYKRKEIKDLVAYLRLAINPDDEEALRRIINYPARGIGDTTLQRLTVAADERRQSLWQTLQVLPQLDLGRTAKPLADFALLVQSCGAVARKDDAYEAARYIAKHSGMLTELHKDNSTEGLSRWENVQELLNAAKEFVQEPDTADKTLAGFLSEISLLTDQDTAVPDSDYVSLMTIHAAKGLEWPSVYICGLEEGLFPNAMSTTNRQDLEEERRLFYVAVTRARQHLCLSHARTRMRYGSIEHNEPSRFLEEVNPRYLRLNPLERDHVRLQQEHLQRKDTLGRTGLGVGPALSHVAGYRQAANPSRQAQPLPSADAAAWPPVDPAALQPGMRLEHAKFGTGTVRSLDGQGADARAVVTFDHAGEKTLILKYARVRLLGQG